MIDLKEIQQISIEEYEKIQEKNKQRKTKFTNKFISKVEKQIEKRAKAGLFDIPVWIKRFGWGRYLDEEEFISYFRKLGFSVDDRKYEYEHEYWWDIISWEVKNDTSRKR